MNFFVSRNFFINFELKMGVEMNLRIITKNHGADPEIAFLKKSILKQYARAMAMPSVWE